MKLTRTKRVHDVAFNITPMIDIVFLLIIFFMTVSQITRVVDQPMALPVVDVGAQSGTASTVTININEEGNIVVSGQQFTLDRTIQILKNRIESTGNVDQMKIELRCDKSCPSEQVNRIIKELAELGIQYVKVAVTGSS